MDVILGRTMEFRNNINALRALAVISVVLFHFKVQGFGGGFAGVDVFFVISGFLIGGIAAIAAGLCAVVSGVMAMKAK